MLCRALLLASLTFLTGCQTFDGMAPSDEKAFRRDPAVIAEEARKLFPFPQQLPDGGQLPALANIDYGINRLDVAQFTGEVLENPQFWINRRYVLTFPAWEDATKYLPLRLFFNIKGEPMPRNFREEQIETLEVVIGGTRYALPFQLKD